MKKKKVKLKDIAEKVGVSTATVSYVLNNHPMTARISDKVAEAIRTTARSMNYHPNQIAKSLKTQKTNTLGLIVADIANPFSGQIARIIGETAHEKGYTVIFGSSDENYSKEQELINTMLNRQVDGLIIAATEEAIPQLKDLEDRGIPFILIDRYFPKHKFSYVGIDNYNASFEAVKLLIQNNRQRIGLISYETPLFHLQERNRGYYEAIEQAGRKTNQDLIHLATLKNLRKDVEEGIARMLGSKNSIDALFFTTNILALHGLRYLKNKGLKTPGDLAIIAFDEAEFYDLWPVSITHIQQPIVDLGVKATEALIDKINRKNNFLQLNISARLVLGRSSG